MKKAFDIRLNDNGKSSMVMMSTPLFFFDRMIEFIYGLHRFVFFLIAYFFSDCIKKIYPGHGQEDRRAMMGQQTLECLGAGV